MADIKSIIRIPITPYFVADLLRNCACHESNDQTIFSENVNLISPEDVTQEICDIVASQIRTYVTELDYNTLQAEGCRLNAEGLLAGIGGIGIGIIAGKLKKSP